MSGNKNNLAKVGIAGAGLGVGGIILFIVLWGMLGAAELEQFPRLILSLCIPPTAIAGVLGVYMLFVRPSGE